MCIYKYTYMHVSVYAWPMSLHFLILWGTVHQRQNSSGDTPPWYFASNLTRMADPTPSFQMISLQNLGHCVLFIVWIDWLVRLNSKFLPVLCWPKSLKRCSRLWVSLVSKLSVVQWWLAGCLKHVLLSIQKMGWWSLFSLFMRFRNIFLYMFESHQPVVSSESLGPHPSSSRRAGDNDDGAEVLTAGRLRKSYWGTPWKPSYQPVEGGRPPC